MRYLCLTIFLVALFSSCQWRDKVPVNEELLFQEELNKIDWTQVDAYPSVDQCDSLLDEAERRACFFEFISTYIQSKLETDTLVSAFPTIDTLEVLVTVFPDSKITIEPSHTSDSLRFNAEKLDSILKIRLQDFPAINPALKRGVPVKTQFILPVILKVD